MPAFKKFGPEDQIDNVLFLEPKYDLVSGSNGWRGSPEGSASLNLYGGARRSPANVFKSIEYQSLNPVARQIGNPVRGYPLTASVNLVWMTDEVLNLSERSATRWGEEHWDTVMRLYQDYAWRDPDFVTASYDYYCLYFQRDSRNIAVSPIYNAAVTAAQLPTASFTLETWAKPFQTASVTNDFTLQHVHSMLWFGITGSTGRLALSSSLGIFTSSFGPTERRWHHLAVTFNSASLSGAFYIDLTHAGDFTMPSSLSKHAGTKFLNVGNALDRGTSSGDDYFHSGSLRRAFHGFIGETRYWTTPRTWAQLSASHGRRLRRDEMTGTLALLHFNDGPLRRFKWTETIGGAVVVGSGSENPGSPSYGFVMLNGFGDRVGPVWHPNDNTSFRPDKSLAPVTFSGSFVTQAPVPVQRGDDVRRMLVVDIPSAFYGREIARNSLRMECRAYSSGSHGLVRVLVDDGRGGLYLSGSACSSSIADREDYGGVGWNKVGNVFYGEGLVVIRDPALLDFGRTDGASSHPDDTFQLSFRGTSMVPVKTLMCRIDRGEFNCSANPTFSTEEEDGQRVRSQPSGSLRISTVGIYNKDRELVGVARLADPLRVRPRDRMSVKLRIDF